MMHKEKCRGIEGAAHIQAQAFMLRDNKRKGRPVKKTGAGQTCGI